MLPISIKDKAADDTPEVIEWDFLWGLNSPKNKFAATWIIREQGLARIKLDQI